MLHYYLNMCQEGPDVQVFPLHIHVWVNCHALTQQISPSLEQLSLSENILHLVQEVILASDLFLSLVLTSLWKIPAETSDSA